MNVLRLLVVSLIVSGCLGCGSDSKPPAAAPPPPFKPASDVLTDNATGENASTPATADAAEDAVVAEEPSADADSNEEMTDDAGSASVPDATGDADDTDEPGSVASDESNQDEPVVTNEPDSPEPVTNPDAEKPAKAKSSKWLRGLGNALNRAASKTLGGAAQSTGPAPKQPKPEDDPFPDGEPEQEKPEE